jgi:hypothetical protein
MPIRTISLKPKGCGAILPEAIELAYSGAK